MAELHFSRANGLTSVRFLRCAPRCIQLPANDDPGPLGNDRLVEICCKANTLRSSFRSKLSAFSVGWRKDIRKGTLSSGYNTCDRLEKKKDPIWWILILHFSYRVCLLFESYHSPSVKCHEVIYNCLVLWCIWIQINDRIKEIQRYKTWLKLTHLWTLHR